MRSMTVKATSAPSCVGSMCTRKGRLPNGMSTILAIASPTAAASASGGTIAENACAEYSMSARRRQSSYTFAEFTEENFHLRCNIDANGKNASS